MPSRKPNVPHEAQKLHASSSEDRKSGRRAPSSAVGASARTGDRRASTTVAPARATLVPGHRPEASRLFSGRIVGLCALLAVLALLVFPAANDYFQQRAAVAAAKNDIEHERQRHEELQKSLDRWQDPAYVRQQARERVNMAMPGETGYWVYGKEPANEVPQHLETTRNPQGLPWAQGLWQSLVQPSEHP